MAPQLSRQRIVHRDVLRELGDTRLVEANILHRNELYAGAIYLGGYAVECYLKLAVCVTLGWDVLYGMFKTHDLEGLLLYSGLTTRMRADSSVVESFSKIIDLWQVDTPGSIRYRLPTEIDGATAATFLECVQNPNGGVVTWLKATVSA